MANQPKSCSCGKQLDRRNATGKCRSCYFRWSATNPDLIAKRSASLRAYCGTKEGRAKLSASSRSKVAWCPLEYRAEYARINRDQHIPARQARVIIEAQIAADAARYARTGQLQQSRRAG